jgi:hypothetical protein
MTYLSLLLSVFPAFIFLLALISLIWLIFMPSTKAIMTLLFILYLFPLIIYRIHNVFHPIPLGLSDLRAKEYNPWWGSQQIQLIYNTFPSLEKVLHLCPGLFSLWLRLWGAKIGKNVYWVPSVTVLDRGLLEVGDQVIFGHLSGTSSHIIKPVLDKLYVYVQWVKIGDRVLVGGESRVGAGAYVKPGVVIPFRHTVLPGEIFPSQVSEAIDASK